jgi:hypothetical protein
VEVAGTNTKPEKNIESDLSSAVGKQVDPEVLQNQLMDLKGDGRFSSLSYHMTDRDSKPGLLITGVEKAYSPPIVQPLLLLDGSNFNGVRIMTYTFGPPPKTAPHLGLQRRPC